MTAAFDGRAFDSALKFTLRWEGGFSDNPADPGGATMKGVTQAVYNHWRHAHEEPTQPVEKITDAEVRAIYYHNYWLAAGCDGLPGNVATVHFDWAVNGGCSKAVKTLQTVVGVTADGLIGPATRAAIGVYVQVHGESGLSMALLNARDNWYTQRVRASPRMKVFFKGWLNRTAALRRWIGLA